MKCLIIAAGKGSRLQMRGESKPLISLFGVPLIERVIHTARSAGISEFYVVTGYRANQVDPFLLELAERLEVAITPLFNEDWEKENGISVLQGKEHLPEPFLLLMSDHIFEPSAARRVIHHPLPKDHINLGVDRNTANPSVDLEDVTRVRIVKTKVRELGKGLDNFNGFDTGIFACTPALFEGIEQSVEETGDTSLTGGVRLLAAQGRVNAVDVGQQIWVDVDDPATLRYAENALLEQLQAESR